MFWRIAHLLKWGYFIWALDRSLGVIITNQHTISKQIEHLEEQINN